MKILKSKKLLWGVIILAVLGVVALGFAAEYYLDNRRPNFQKKYVLYVYPDMTVEQVLDSNRSI